MISGSILIDNDFGSKTMLVIRDGKALADPSPNALIFATKAKRIAMAANSPKDAEVAFLTEWIERFNNPIEEKKIAVVTDRVVNEQVQGPNKLHPIISHEKQLSNAEKAKQIAEDMKKKRG